MWLKAIQTNWVVKRMKTLGHLITVGRYHKVVLLFNPIESQILLEDIFTVQANIAGTPAVSIPIGVDPKGLPIGLQVMGANGSDMDTLAIAAWIQKQ